MRECKIIWLIGEWSNLVMHREWFRDNWNTKKQESVWRKALNLLARKSGKVQQDYGGREVRKREASSVCVFCSLKVTF